uniref:Tctex 1 n=1 Tax=Echinococcus granulosus TaxID=6210 RepID=A0A068WWC3_ECHGR|nr:Tctex 1 [Echinococcus granulosus]
MRLKMQMHLNCDKDNHARIFVNAFENTSFKNKNTKEEPDNTIADGSEPQGYIIRPEIYNRFRPSKVREVMREILKHNLEDVKYEYEKMPDLTKGLSDKIRDELRNDPTYKRYTFLVQVVIGEQKGQGVKASCRCFWDSDSDNYAEVCYLTPTLFCVAIAFGVYNY